MTKKLIIIDRAGIEGCIERGGSVDGDYYLYVRADADGTTWTDFERRNEWGGRRYDARMKIPALIPDGEGDYYEDAVDDWQRDARHAQPELYAAFQATKRAAEEDDGGFSTSEAYTWLEENDPEWLDAFRENGVDWLVSAFEQALNGRGDDLDDPDPWGDQEIDGQAIEAVFEFEIARSVKA